MMGSEVTLVIPGRNAAGTIESCLRAVVPLLQQGLLHEILFVDDGSTDDTATIVDRFPVRRLPGTGSGPGAARNIGWRAATTPLVWFIDSDCVAEPDALELLLQHMDGSELAGVGGSYGNMLPESLLACLIHEEIIERHRAMPREVNFLATFNVLYRREMLDKVGGIDERFLKAQDAELAYRIRQAEGRLGFELDSRVKHYHPHRLGPYLKTQRQQGYWRAWLYFEYPGRMGGDSYSGLADHLQPVLALLSLAFLPLVLWPPAALAEALSLLALCTMQLPMTARIVSRTGAPRYALFGAMSLLRSYARGLGLIFGTLAALASRVSFSQSACAACSISGWRRSTSATLHS
jgi:glycosyltransferase involved in cell wall biosynthesis